MPKSRPGFRRLLPPLVALLAIAGFALATPSAQAVQDTSTRRISGSTRYATSANIALDAFPDGVDNVVLATGGGFADALAASGLAGALGAPVLLTQTSAIPSSVSTALDTLAPTTVYLMGGTAAISEAVATSLTDSGYAVERISGNNRYQTAAAAGDAIAASADGLGETDNGVTALLANALNFPDAVSASPIAWAGRLPVLLTGKDSLHPDTATAIDDLGIEHVVILGGAAAVSQSIQDGLEADGLTVQRLSGKNRYATNVAIANYAQDEFGFSGPTATLATGEKYPDALAGSAFSGKLGSVLLLTQSTALSGRVENFLIENAGPYDAIVALGGTAVIPNSVLSAAAAAAVLDSPQSYDVSPASSVALTPSPSSCAIGVDCSGERAYTAAGLQPSTTYTIGLLEPSVVKEEGGKITSYTLTAETTTTVEGDAQSTTKDSTEEGTLEFLVNATEHDSVIPVVFLDDDGDGQLDIAASTPLEEYGVGGRVSWVPEEAAADDYCGGNTSSPFDNPDRVVVDSLDREARFFVTSQGTFYYKPTDFFTYSPDQRTTGECSGGENSISLTLSQFSGMLSTTDRIKVEYNPDGQSQFNVVEDEQLPLTGVSAASTTTNQNGHDVIVISWNASDQPDARYHVYRDNNYDGLYDSGDSLVDMTTSDGQTSLQTTYSGSPTTAQYIVRLFGGVSGEEYFVESSTHPIPPHDYFETNEIRIGDDLIGLSEGSTVAVNASPTGASQGDVWLLHFSKQVAISSNSSITVNGTTFANNGVSSTWTASGSTITITLGTVQATFSYGGVDAEIDALIGVTDAGGNSIAKDDLRDTLLEDDGPELMEESSVCNVGDDGCTIAFNEPVVGGASDGSAINPANYTYNDNDGVPNEDISSVSLGADGRTITLSFDGFPGAELALTDEIAPDGVDDLEEGDTSSQSAITFVVPAP